VAAAGKKFAFMKATEDVNFVDPTYTSNRASARAAGLSVGAYHFAQPSTVAGNGAAQADYFVNGATPASGDLLPVLDLERSNGLTPTQLTTWVKDFLGRVYTRLGVRGIIYCSPSFWKTYMGDTGWFASNGYTILWVAHWTTSSSPTVPAANWGGKSWTFWQYTSSGTVPGISGRVDLDRYNGTDLTKVRVP
jgi:lysozyme